MQIPEIILEKLRCSKCNEYLSYSPILLGATGDNLCGRCTIPKDKKETYVKNQIFEDLASLMVFPCKNRKGGCGEKLKVTQVKSHEQSCEYIYILCPIRETDLCLWSGKLEDIEDHYMKNHPNLLVQQPFQLPSVSKGDNAKYFLCKVFGFLFLFQIKYVYSAGELWHNGILLGPPNLAHIFKYTLTLEKGNNSIAICKEMSPYGTYILHEDHNILRQISCCQVAIEKGHFNIELSVDIKYLKCCICCTALNCAPIYQSKEEGKYCCADCGKENLKKHCMINGKPADSLLQCNTLACPTCGAATMEKKEKLQKATSTTDDKSLSNKSMAEENKTVKESNTSPMKETCWFIEKGCDYIASDEKFLHKHHVWLCRYTDDSCGRCGKKYNGTRPIDHLAEVHSEVAAVTVNKNEATVICKKVGLGEWFYSIKAHNRLFCLRFYFTDDIDIWLLCDAEESGQKYFSCKYRITFSGDRNALTGELSPGFFRVYDWYNDIKLRGYPLPEEYDFTLIITKLT